MGYATDPYLKEVLKDGPQALIRMADISAAQALEALSSAHLSLTGSPTNRRSGRSGWATSGNGTHYSSGFSWEFPGTTADYLSRGSISQYSPASGMTLECWAWINPETTRDSRAGNIVCKENSTTGYRVVVNYNAGNPSVFWGFQDGGVYRFSTSIVIARGYGRWVHLVGTNLSGSGNAGYIDGAAVTTWAGNNCTTNGSNFTVGRYATSAAEGFAGRIADIAVYSGAVGADRIRAHYLAGARRLPVGANRRMVRGLGARGGIGKAT